MDTRIMFNPVHNSQHHNLTLIRGTADAEMKDPIVGVRGYQRFPISNLGAGHNIALHVGPADRTSVILVSSFGLMIQIHFFSPKLVQ